jgi:hypothetical protein
VNDLRLVETFEELVPMVELLDVRFFEVSGVVDRTAIGVAETSGEAETSAESESPTQLQLGQSEDRRQIGVSVRMEAKTDLASFVVAAGVEYSCSEAVELTEGVKAEFANRLAFMTLVPFLREGLITTAARLRVNPPVVPLIRAGAFAVGEPRRDSE